MATRTVMVYRRMGYYLNLIAFSGLILLTSIDGTRSTMRQINTVATFSKSTSEKWNSMGT